MDYKNYTLGRGEVWFARFKTGTQTPDGFVYFGNTPEFNLTIESETLDHYSSDYGIREKDDSVPLQVNRTGSLITDNINPRNIALFYFGTDSVVTQVLASATTETIADVKLEHAYQLGQSHTNPVGLVGIEDLVVEKGAVTFVVDVDYELNADLGMLKILPGGAIVAGDDLELTYDVKSSTRERVISGTQPVEGALRYIARNPKGKQFNYYMPYVKLSPNGDYALKGDEWQQIPYTMDIQKPNVGEAIYVDGAPTFA